MSNVTGAWSQPELFSESQYVSSVRPAPPTSSSKGGVKTYRYPRRRRERRLPRVPMEPRQLTFG